MPELEDTLEQALALWQTHAETIRRDELAAGLLERLAAAAANVQRKTRAARMDYTCLVCSAQSGGGCCGASVAKEADPLLLLVNRLLGSPAVPQHDDFTECCFLGPRGCILPIKPFLCTNYDCRDLIASVDVTRHQAVREARAELLEAWLAVEARLSDLIPTATCDA